MITAEVGGALGSLVTLGIDEAIVADLRAFLDESAGLLEDSRPDDVGGKDFGASPSSLQCASDASKAQTHVAEALVDMAAGLVGYARIVTDLKRTTDTIEDNVVAETSVILDRSEACVAPSFAAPSQCTMPGASSEGDR